MPYAGLEKRMKNTTTQRVFELEASQRFRHRVREGDLIRFTEKSWGVFFPIACDGDVRSISIETAWSADPEDNRVFMYVGSAPYDQIEYEDVDRDAVTDFNTATGILRVGKMNPDDKPDLWFPVLVLDENKNICLAYIFIDILGEAHFENLTRQ